MKIIIYGDFSCPYSYLASLRADQLLASGTAMIEWRSVIRNQNWPAAGSGADGGRDDWDRLLGDVARLVLAGEVPPGRPAGVVNAKACDAAYSEAVSDGVQDQIRRRMFAAIWAEGRHMTSVDDVREVIAEVMCPPDPILPHLISPDLPLKLLHDPDVCRIMRQSGGTVTDYGGPLTATGGLRLRRWRENWLALPHRDTPAITDPANTFRPRVAALLYLAKLA